MSQAQDVQIKPEIQKGTAPFMNSRTLWMLLLAAVVVGVLAFGTVSANQDLSPGRTGVGRSTNPELSAAQRYAELASISPVRDLLAVNPELKSISSSAEGVRSESRYDRAVNPEVYFAQRFAETPGAVRERNTAWIANPELSAANRFAETSAKGAVRVNPYANPELKVLERYAAQMDQTYRSDFLATNPEIKIHQRYAAGIGK